MYPLAALLVILLPFFISAIVTWLFKELVLAIFSPIFTGNFDKLIFLFAIFSWLSIVISGIIIITETDNLRWNAQVAVANMIYCIGWLVQIMQRKIINLFRIGVLICGSAHILIMVTLVDAKLESVHVKRMIFVQAVALTWGIAVDVFYVLYKTRNGFKL